MSTWNASADNYDNAEVNDSRYRVVANAMLERVRITRNERVVDLGCGTGVLTGLLLARFGRLDIQVFSVDSASAMIERASAACRHKQVQFIHGPAEELAALVPAPVDLVLCNAAFWLMDMRAVFGAVRKTLRPGGVFAASMPAADSGRKARDVFQLYARSRLAWLILEERQLRGHGAPRTRRTAAPSVVRAEELAKDLQWEQAFSAAVETTSPAESVMAYLDVPAMRGWSSLLADLDDVERTDILTTVRYELAWTDAHASPKRWQILGWRR